MPSSEPKNVRVNKTSGTGMEIDWEDGHRSAYKFQLLRDACPCATCDDEREKAGVGFGEAPKPAAAKGALPMYKEPVRPTEVTPVGKYAISFVWNDGHRTGIYSWEFLRMICPCEECKVIRAAGGRLVPGGSGAIYG
ncbi:MAG: hypothetical protein JWO13_66 [Acidobacteriales bacterium]|nr:hypothetical protein [Terriglobales bacterium]